MLASGDYMAATTGEEMTIDASKSFWNFTDKDNHNDKIKNRLKEGTKIHIVSNGDHNYTITGTLEGTSDKTGKNTGSENQLFRHSSFRGLRRSGTRGTDCYGGDHDHRQPGLLRRQYLYSDPQGRQPDRYLRSVALVQTTRFGDPAGSSAATTPYRPAAER